MALQFRPVISGPSGSVAPIRGGMEVPFSLADANLDASATPLTEPPKPKDLRQRMIERLIAAGMDPAAAVRTVDADLARNAETAPMSEELFEANNTPQRNAALGDRLAAGNRADKRMDAFETNYNAAIGETPEDFSEGLGSADVLSDGRVWNGRGYSLPMATQGRVDAPAPLGYTAPGPRTLDGKAPTPRRALGTPEEMEDYSVRPEGGLSKQDAAMRARGMVPVMTPNGVRYMLASDPSGGEYAIDGEPGRAGARPELAGKYATDTKVGPDGNVVAVLAPTKEFADGQKAVMKTRREALDADLRSRRAHRLALAKLAGGSQNINSGNRWMAEALLAMTPEQRSSSMRYMLPGGQLAGGVDAKNMENANDVIKRFMTSGAAAGANNPVTAAAIQQQQLQGQQGMVDWAEQNINDNYSWDSDTWIPGSDFTAAERDQAIQDLMQRYGPPAGTLTLADATRLVDNIGQRKPRPAAAAATTGSTGPGGLPVPPGATPYRTGP